MTQNTLKNEEIEQNCIEKLFSMLSIEILTFQKKNDLHLGGVGDGAVGLNLSFLILGGDLKVK